MRLALVFGAFILSGSAAVAEDWREEDCDRLFEAVKIWRDSQSLATMAAQVRAPFLGMSLDSASEAEQEYYRALDEQIFTPVDGHQAQAHELLLGLGRYLQHLNTRSGCSG